MPDLTKRLRPHLKRWYVTLPASLLLAAVLMELLFEERQGPHHLAVQLLIIWTPLALIWLSPRLVRCWRQVLVLLGAAALCLAVLWAVGPWIMLRVALPTYNEHVDHRPKPLPGKVNADGVMPDTPASHYRPGELNIIFLGDSYTLGTENGRPGGMAPHNTIPGQVEKLLGGRARGVRVANFGWTPSSPVLQLRQLHHIGAKYSPDLVVQLFDMSDFADDIDYADRLALHQGVQAPSIVDYFRAGAAVALGVDDPLRWLWRCSIFGDRAARLERERVEIPETRRFFHVFQPLSRSLPHMELSWTTLLRTHRMAARLGARYVVFVLPRYQQFNPSEAPRDWERPAGAVAPGRRRRDPKPCRRRGRASPGPRR